MTESATDPLSLRRLEQSSRSKFRPLLEAATRHFGVRGFETAKWSDVAADVGIGPTALYHYFQSKTECLFALIVVQFEEAEARFKAAVEGVDDPYEQIRRAIGSNFDLTEIEVLRSRIVVSERNRLSEASKTGREEDMRRLARDWARRTELSWSAFLRGHMEAGAIPYQDDLLLSRAVLGLASSAYSWYRPDGAIPIERVKAFYVEAAMKIIVE